MKLQEKSYLAFAAIYFRSDPILTGLYRQIYVKYFLEMQVMYIRSSHPELFLGKGVLKICSKITEDRQCWYAVLIKLLCHFIEITLQHWCSPVNSRHIFRTPFLMSTSRWLQSEHVLSKYETQT